MSAPITGGKMGDLTLGLLGGFRLERADRQPVRVPTKKAKALLAYLALHGREPQPRAKLAHLLWEDSDEGQARESLRQALKLLRQALSPACTGALIAQDDAVLFEPGALSVDLIDFQRQFDGSEPDQLEMAAQLYRGQLLEGFDLGAPEFESWLRTERQRLNEKALAALEKLLAYHLANNAVEGAITVATRLLALDPLRESAHRSLMQLYGKQGRHAAALRQFRICADTLKKELGVEPDAATIALYREIRQERYRPRNGVGSSPRLETPESGFEAEPLPLMTPLAVERRHLTVLVCDLGGLSAASAHIDPEELRRAIANYKRCCEEIVSQFGGIMQKFSGDSLVACFGYPEAHEHDPERAIRAGLALVEAVPRSNDALAAPVHARVGIATGPAAVADFAEDGAEIAPGLLGEPPRLAALLQSIAEPGAVMVAANTRDLVRGLFEYQPATPVTPTGSSESVPVWRVVRESSDEVRFEAFHGTALTPFVGREPEIELLLQLWQQARTGEGRIVLISGEPGIGKSRLVRAVQEELADEPHSRLRYQCSPFHANSALHPFIQQLERAAGFQLEEEPGPKLDKLEAILAMGASRVAAVAPLLAALLSIPSEGRYPPLELSPVQQRRQTLAALLDQLEGLARKRPVLQVLEDAQWVDATSRELIDLGVERIRRLPVLCLITFRPEFEPPWAGLPSVSTLTLGRLERQHVQTMAEQVSGGGSLDRETTEQIITRSDGIPLFVEELTKTVLQMGILSPVQGVSPQVVPETLHDSLMARLDRLVAAKEIAQNAAAIGREFSYALLSSVIERDGPALQPALAQLEQAQLVFRKGEPPEAAYTFKHALLQDAAYQSLPKNRRHGLHRRIAETIRDRFPAIAETQPEVVAHHFTQAGLTEDAVTWWGKAGTFALRHSAFVEAIAHLEKALELADNLAQGPAECLLRLRLQLSYGEALQAARGYGAPETAAAFERARELAEISQDPEAKFLAISGLWAGSWVRSELAPMRRWAEALRRDAERQAAAGGMCGLTSWFEGNFVGAREQFERALAAHNVGASSKSSLKSYLAVVLWPLGEVADARLAADDAIVHATRSQQILTIANAHAYTGRYEMTRCDPHRALQHAEPLVTLSREHDLRFFLPVGMFTLGWAHWHGGEREPGMAEMCEGIELARKEGIFHTIPAYVTFLAEAKSRAGQADIGLAMLDEVFAQIDRTKQRVIEAEIHRIRGQILLRRAPADHAAAEASFIRAIEIARNQQTKSYELRATLALAKLYHATGREKLIPELLMPAVGHFANEIELPELEEARRLLTSIRAN